MALCFRPRVNTHSLFVPRVECARRKQIGGFNINASNNPTISNQHTPPTIPSFGNNQNARGGVVTNPYSKQAIRDPSSNAPRNAQSNNSGNDIPSGKEGNNVLPYASNMMTHGITPEFHQGQQRNREINTQHHHHHHPHRHGGYVRNQRQFGTSVGVSIDSGVMDAPRTTSLSSTTPLSYPPSSTKYMANTTEDSLSDASSASSDEDILSFNIFGKKWTYYFSFVQAHTMLLCIHSYIHASVVIYLVHRNIISQWEFRLPLLSIASQ